MLYRYNQIFRSSLLLADLTLVGAAWLAAYGIRFFTIFDAPLGIPPFAPYAQLLALILPVWFWLFRSRGLYEPQRTGSMLGEAGNVIGATTVGTVVLVAATFFLRSYYYSRGVVLIFYALSALSVVGFRLSGRLVFRALRRRGYNLRHLLVVGAGALAQRVTESIRKNPETGGHVIGVLSSGGAQLWPTTGDGDPMIVTEQENLDGCAFSPDGTQILTARGSGDNTVRMWPADGTGEPVEFRGHSDWVRGGVGFSPDGSRIVSAAVDWTARVWPADGTTEPLVIQLRGQPHAAMFTPDGTRILTAAAGEVRIQRVTWPALLEYLRENTRASLTPEQRMKYLAETPREAWATYAESERRQGRTPAMPRPN